jgi:hypothetical protein
LKSRTIGFRNGVSTTSRAIDSFDRLLNSWAACHLVESSIRTRNLHTVTCPQNQRPTWKCQCATVFLNVSFPLRSLDRNYRLTYYPRFYYVFCSTWSALQSSSSQQDNARKHSTTAVAMTAIFDTAPVASSVEGSATGTPCSTTAGDFTSGAIPVRDQPRANREAAVEDDSWDEYNTPPTRSPDKSAQGQMDLSSARTDVHPACE